MLIFLCVLVVIIAIGTSIIDEFKKNKAENRKYKLKRDYFSVILRSLATVILAICILSFIVCGIGLWNGGYSLDEYIGLDRIATIIIFAALSAIAIIVTSIEGNMRCMFEQQNELLASYFNNDNNDKK